MKKTLILFAILVTFVQFFYKAQASTDSMQNKVVKNGIKTTYYDNNGKISGWTINLPNRTESYDSKGMLLNFTEKMFNKVTQYNNNGQVVDSTVHQGDKIIHYDNKGKIINTEFNPSP